MAENAHSTTAPKIPAPLQNREDVEHLVEDLIAWLDDTDGDPDLEPDVDDEPSIGGNVQNFAAVDTELDTADTEPTLGYTEHQMAIGRLDFDDWRILDEAEVDDEGDDLEIRGESDGLENGEHDDGEGDGNLLIEGGGSGRL